MRMMNRIMNRIMKAIGYVPLSKAENLEMQVRHWAQEYKDCAQERKDYQQLAEGYKMKWIMMETDNNEHTRNFN